MQNKTQKKKYYVFIIPKRADEQNHSNYFLLSYPESLKKCKFHAQEWAVMEKCAPERIKIVQCHIPKTTFSAFRSRSTYCIQKEIDAFHKLNDEYQRNKNFLASNQLLFSSNNLCTSVYDDLLKRRYSM